MFIKRISVNKPIVFISKRYFNPSFVDYKIVPFNLADIGEGITKCEIIEYYVNTGDKIQEFDKVCEVQSDKATVEITSRFNGYVKKLYYKKGELAIVGTPLIDVEVEEEINTEKVYTARDAIEQNVSVVAGPAKQKCIKVQEENNVLATPAIRRVAMENKIDLYKIKGTGREGRIMKEDLFSYLNETKHIEEPYVVEDSEESKDLTMIQQAMFKTMTKSLEIPHFVYSDEFNIDKLIELKQKTKITILPILIKLFSIALIDFPILNACLVNENKSIKYRKEHNIGIAIDANQGLIVPNIENVRNKNIKQIHTSILELKKLAAEKKLSKKHFIGTTITISNIGSIGGQYFYPVIAQKNNELCIVAIGKMYKALSMLANKEIYESNKINISMSADHRIIDGATVAKFCNRWKYLIEHVDVAITDLK